jgi:signal transduction histidine kinase
MRRSSLPPADALIVSPIVRSAKRMARMINQILDFTRVRLGGGFEIEPRASDLVEVCREMISECAHANPDRQIVLTSGDSVSGVWDRDRLCEVVSNLRGNALQHGAPDAPVEVELATSPDEAVLRVRNQGKPIPADVLPHVFDPFRRARSKSETTRPDSLGLGLYISKEIVASHGGSIAVESSKDATIL